MANSKKTTPNRGQTRNQVNSSSARQDSGFVARTGRTIKRQPYASAAIATGAVAAVAGLFFFRRSDKSLGEFTSDLTTRAKDGLADVGTMAKDSVTRLRDGVDQPKSQSEIAEEALTLKMTGGAKSDAPIDPLVADQAQVGSIAY